MTINTDEIINELPLGLLYWYDFKTSKNILYIGNNKRISKFLKSKCENFTNLDINVDINIDLDNLSKFDYIVAINILETSKNPSDFISKLKSILQPQGKLLLATQNRLGLQYFCGAKDPFTNRNFDGIENYMRATDSISNGRAYSKSELKSFLDVSSFNYQFFSVLPNLELPQLIYSENFTPKEELSGRYFPLYKTPHTIFLEEEFLYSDMIENDLFHTMANTFFIECTIDGKLSNTQHATLSMDRGLDKAIATIIKKDKTVEKKMLYKEGENRLNMLDNNTRELSGRFNDFNNKNNETNETKNCISKSVSIIHGKRDNLSYIMPYVEGQSLVKYLRELFFKNNSQFIDEIDYFREIILNSSNHIVDEKILSDLKMGQLVPILEKGYIDLIPLNALHTDNGIEFFDQEIYYENYPANAILFRAISCVYIFDAKMEKILPMSFFWKRYNMYNDLEIYKKYDEKFIQDLRNKKELSPFYRKFERNHNIVHSNRQKINYSSIEYQKIFIDLFRDIEDKKIILFGSGNFAKKFIAFYGKQYKIECIVDNNKNMWGSKFVDDIENLNNEKINIESPDFLKSLAENDKNGYRVIVCVKNYGSIVQQLENMNVKNYCVYDPNISYQTNIISNVSNTFDTSIKKKKYKKGYIAGVFDLFHIGHLNLLKRAKEQCEYLIVGVVTDEGVVKYKKTETVIGFKERLEIVGSCKYVDEAVEIPLSFGGSEDAYNLYRFDCQFSGSDYTNDPTWLSEKEFLEAQGAELVFFPYTEGTSSTKLKAFLKENTGK